MSARSPMARLELPLRRGAHDPRSAQAAHDRDAPFLKAIGDQVGRAGLLKAQFGMRVDIPADVSDFMMELDDPIDQVHGVPVGRGNVQA